MTGSYLIQEQLTETGELQDDDENDLLADLQHITIH
jgi:hypothetical protein